MTTATTTTPTATPAPHRCDVSPHAIMRAALLPLSRRRRTIALWSGLPRWGWIITALLLLAVLGDGLWRFPALLRLVFALALLGLTTRAVWQTWRGLRTPANWPQEARLVDDAGGRSDNAAINATMLALGNAGDAPVTEALRQRALERGRQAATATSPRQLISSRPAWRQGAALLAVVVAALLLAMIEPRMGTVGLSRLALPWGDHPPFSRTLFEVTAQPGGQGHEPLYTGQNATIDATLRGVIPTEAWLAIRDDTGRIAGRWPMRRLDQDAGHAAFDRVLRDVRQPLTFRVEAGDGWSRWTTLEPRQRDATKAERDDATNATPDAAESSLTDGGTSGGTSGTTGQAGQIAAGEELRDAATQLASQAAALASRLLAVRETNGTELPDWAVEQLRALDAARARFAQRAGALGSRLGDAGERLRLPGSPPMPTVPQAAANKPEAWSQWVTQLGAAAAGDADTLLSGLQTLGVDPTVGSAPTPTLATGTSGQTVAPGQTLADPTQARLQSVPPIYRDLVARYHQQLDKPWPPPSDSPQGNTQ